MLLSKTVKIFRKVLKIVIELGQGALFFEFLINFCSFYFKNLAFLYGKKFSLSSERLSDSDQHISLRVQLEFQNNRRLINQIRVQPDPIRLLRPSPKILEHDRLYLLDAYWKTHGIPIECLEGIYDSRSRIIWLLNGDKC
jgi:hypothetical protein